MKRYCVWGVDKTYRYLWVACVVAGIRAAKQRWNLSGHENAGNGEQP